LRVHRYVEFTVILRGEGYIVPIDIRDYVDLGSCSTQMNRDLAVLIFTG
jgi:hypothetical protein